MVFLGIDPGIAGAVAAIVGTEIVLHDTPVVQVKVGAKLKNQIDPHACAVLLRRFKAPSALNPDEDLMVVIEKVSPMPSYHKDESGVLEERRTMGATSAFNFGRDYGIWVGVCAALEIPFELVHPLTWKKRIMAGIAGGKDAGRVRAMQLYPHAAPELARKKDHGRADALLLARFGQMTYAPATIEAPQPATLFG